ncbi:hypothetical protein C8R46DRAFT_1116401 [Mycena filopes]|nr:hypothetical protein C8R46DRAFT_1116401 [Mycena filopes]
MKSRAKPTRRRTRCTLPLPPEICATICEGVGRKDLVTLCRTSRLFGDQAQRMLYRTVDLSRPTPRALSSWCLAVNRRSHLAERVHTLDLGLPDDLAFSSDVAKIARALSRCINLKELSVHVDRFGSFGPQSSSNNSIQGWILTKCPFRLTKFSNGFFNESFLAQFWTPQAELRVLALPNCGIRFGSRFPTYEDQLPHLIALEVGGVEALPHDRPLQRIQLRWVGERFAEVSPLSGLARFKQLQTLVLYCQRITAFGNYHLDDVADLSDFASAIMKEACPTLRRAVVAARGYRTPALVYDWYRGSDRWETTLVLTRDASGEIKEEFSPRFNFRAVSMFWED